MLGKFLLELFKGTWNFYGLKAPPFIWIAASALFFSTLSFFLIFWFKVRRETKVHSSVSGKIRKLSKEHPSKPGEGLPLAAFDAATRIFEETPALQGAWQLFSSQLIQRRSPSGEVQIWVAQGADTFFSEDAVITARLNRAFYSAIPGIVTGVGLLFTFIAILIALLDVKLTGTKQVEGIDLLITGLSGKFISSIIALGAATIYLLLEKPLLHRLTLSRQQLVATLNSLFPILLPSQLLSDLGRDIAEQSTSFRSFNADLSQKLKQSFSESMGPTLVRMVTAVEDLNQLLRAAEAQKQESITGSLEELLQKVEISITHSLQKMTNQFTEAISGGARNEFAGVIDSLHGAAGIMEKMNAQFVSTQQALGELTDLSKRMTTEQIQLGRSQIEELTEVLRGLMSQINETAGSSVSRMAATLTGVVYDLSQKVGELGDKMSNSIIDSAGLATGAATEVIEKANKWSEQSAQQLTDLLEVHHQQLDTVKGLRNDLEQSLIGFRSALQDFGTVSAGLRHLVADASAASTSIAGVAKSLRDTHASVENVATLAATQIERLTDANRGQQDVWVQIHNNMGQYEALFKRVDAEASSLLSQIGEHLENYVATSRKGFENLIKISDEHFTNATKRLGSSVNELDEVLQVLIEDLGKRKN